MCLEDYLIVYIFLIFVTAMLYFVFLYFVSLTWILQYLNVDHIVILIESHCEDPSTKLLKIKVIKEENTGRKTYIRSCTA